MFKVSNKINELREDFQEFYGFFHGIIIAEGMPSQVFLL